MTESKEQSVYETLSKIDVEPYLKQAGEAYNKKTQTYTPLYYLPWANAWSLVKANFPTANYKLLEYPNWITTKDGHVEQSGTLDYRITKAGVEVGATVTIEGESYTQRLYPMESKQNKPIKDPDIAQINKAQMRALVKALAIAGLGLNVYAGEDLPANEDETPKRLTKKEQAQKIAEEYKKRIKAAKKYEVQYGGGKEKLTKIVSLQKSGDEQAQRFLDVWTKRDKKNQAAYEFINANNLYEEKKEA